MLDTMEMSTDQITDIKQRKAMNERIVKIKIALLKAHYGERSNDIINDQMSDPTNISIPEDGLVVMFDLGGTAMLIPAQDLIDELTQDQTIQSLSGKEKLFAELKTLSALFSANKDTLLAPMLMRRIVDLLYAEKNIAEADKGRFPRSRSGAFELFRYDRYRPPDVE